MVLTHAFAYMTLVPSVLTDAFFYHGAFFSMVLTDAFFYHDAGF